MILSLAILQIYPDVDLLNTVIVRDDGNGEYIEVWNDPRPQPDQAALDAAWLEYESGALDRAKAEAYQIVNDKADTKALALDNTLWFSEAQLPLEFVADEISRWYVAGQPASPPAAQYKIGNQLSQVRGESIGDTILWMAGKWQTLYSQTAQLIAQRYNFIQQVTGAATVAEIQTILESVASW